MGKLLFHRLSTGILVLMLAFMLGALVGCEGDDGAPGADGAAGLSAYEIAVQNGFDGTEQEWLLQQEDVEPESCSVCHDGSVVRSGESHQLAYDELFQHGVVEVMNIMYSSVPDGAGGFNDQVTFDMTKNGVPFDCTMADSLSIVFSEYIAATDTFELGSPGFNYGIGGTLVPGPGATCTSTKAQGAKGDLSLLDGIVVVYGNDEIVTADPVAHLSLARYPFAGIQELGLVTYSSAANATGCQNCHTTPYFKHGFILADVDFDTVAAGTRDFYTCKACHLDDLNGGHEEWQLIVDDPKFWASGAPLSAAQESKYAYKKSLMNDVHMSHAMEFPYPQSIANCATCHAGKLAVTVSPANFVLETCKSCHPVTGGTDFPDADGDFEYDTTGIALETLIPHEFNDTTPCTLCHNGAAGAPPAFNQIHTGYNPTIYANTSGAKYLDSISVSIDDANFVGNVLTIDVSAMGTAGGLDSVNIIPTVLVGLYGWDTKDYIVGPHERDADRNRLLEFELGDTNPRVTGTVVAPGQWQFTADLSMWADYLADGTVKRAEIGVMPTLEDANGDTVALVAPSRTFDLVDNAFDNFFDPIVAVENCNTCHDALATTFHSPNRGGNVVVCRLCHITRSGGSHLEGQSRSIDSYVHAIHSFQAFDVGDVDFNDPVEAAHYEEHVNFLFPDFATINCEACHVDNDVVGYTAYNVPNQSKSMPGLLSATDDVPGREIGAIPEYVTGPATRACGGCHRAQLINADDAGELAAFNQHTKEFGYLVENDDDDNILNAIIFFIMEMFE